jgi:hypothetical protein
MGAIFTGNGMGLISPGPQAAPAGRRMISPAAARAAKPLACATAKLMP